MVRVAHYGVEVAWVVEASSVGTECVRLIVCDRSMAVEHLRIIVGKRCEKKMVN